MDFSDLSNRGNRIRYVREKILGLESQDELADMLKLTRGAVGNWELGKGIGRENLIKLAGLAEVSAEWIDSRQGPDPKPRRKGGAPGAENETELSASSGSIVTSDGEAVTFPAGSIKEVDTRAGLGAGQFVPDAYELESGEWKVVDAMKPEPWILPPSFVRNGFRAPLSKIIAITTQGESMAPTIGHGDVVFIDTTHQRISPPGLYAMRDIYGEIIVKRLEAFREKGEAMVRIGSDNPAHESRFERIADIHVVGRICGMMKLI